MKIIKKRDLIKNVIDTLLHQYAPIDGANPDSTTAKERANIHWRLNCLSYLTATVDDIQKIVSGAYWDIACTCDECGKDGESVIRFDKYGMDDWMEDRTTIYDICPDCLKEALSKL